MAETQEIQQYTVKLLNKNGVKKLIRTLEPEQAQYLPIVRNWLKYNLPIAKAYGLEENGELKSYCLLMKMTTSRFVKQDLPYEIQFLYTFQNHRNQGNAKQLVQNLLNKYDFTVRTEKTYIHKLCKSLNMLLCQGQEHIPGTKIYCSVKVTSEDIEKQLQKYTHSLKSLTNDIMDETPNDIQYGLMKVLKTFLERKKELQEQKEKEGLYEEKMNILNHCIYSLCADNTNILPPEINYQNYLKDKEIEQIKKYIQ